MQLIEDGDRVVESATIKSLTALQIEHLAAGLEVAVVSGRRLTNYRRAGTPEQPLAGHGRGFPKPPFKRRSTDH